MVSILILSHRTLGDDDQSKPPKHQVSIKCTAAAFSHDGKLLVTNENGHVVIRRVRDMRAIRELMPDCGEVNLVAWSHDGKYIATAIFGGFGKADDKSQIEVWRTDQWRPIACIPTRGYARSLIFSPVSNTLAVSSGDFHTTIWDCAGNRLVNRFLEDFCGPLAFSPDGKSIAGMSERWNGGYVRSIRSKHIVARIPDDFGCATFSPDGKFLIANCRGTTDTSQFIAWNIRTGKRRLIAHGMQIGTDIRYIGRNIILAQHQYKSEVIRLSDGKTLNEADYLAIQAISDDNKQMLVSENNGAVLRPSWFRGYAMGRITSHHFPINAGWPPPITHVPADSAAKVGVWSAVTSNPASNQELDRAPAEEEYGSPSKEIAHDRTTRTAFVRHQKSQDLTLTSNIYITRETSEGRKAYCYHIDGDIYRVVWSPRGHYLACECNSDFSGPVFHPWRILDISTGRLSSVAVHSTYDDRIAWSLDEKYLALYGGGLEYSKYSTQQVLCCWDIAKNQATPIVTGWHVRAWWPANAGGNLRFACDGGKVDTFDPITNQIDITNNDFASN